MAVAGFVALGWNSNKAAISTDGLTWAPITLPVASTWFDVAWNGTIFCAISNSSDVAATSPDGVTWTQRVLPSVQSWRSLAWNGTVFCAISSGNNIAATSPDGITWTQRTMASASLWIAIAWNGSVFCAVSEDGIAATSSDGITWTNRTMSSLENWIAIAWNGSVFCAVDYFSGKASTSPDGITWTARTLPASVQWRSITTNGSTFCALASDTSAKSCTSIDHGVTWSSGVITIAKEWYKVTFTNFIYCAVNSNGASSATSNDGITWTEHVGVMPSVAYWRVMTAGLISNITVYSDTITSDIAVISDGIYIPTLNNIVSEVLNIALTGFNGINLTVISDSISYSELLTYLEINNILESITLESTLTNISKVNNSINDYFIIIDNIFIKYLLTISDNIIYTTDILSIIKQIEIVVSTVSLNSDSTTKVSLINNIIDLLNITDILTFGINKSISEVMVIDSIISQLTKFIDALTESININSSNIIIYTGRERLSDDVTIAEDESDIATRNNIINEYFVLSIPTVSGQDTYLAYLLSPETNSLTNYNNYNFKGCTKFNGKYLFYSSTGLYEYGGSTDNGVSVESHITTSALNFGSTNLKQIPAVYLGISNSDKIYLKVSVDGRTNCLYELNKRTTELQTQKIAIGKGLIGRYFQFELITKASEFDLESLDFYPIELKRKL